MRIANENKIASLLEQALSLSPQAREVFVSKVSGNNSALRDRLNILIKAAEKAPEFFDKLSPAIKTPSAEHQLAQGTIIAHFRILKQIGAGGMGVVYLAEDLRLERQVALKFLPPYLTHNSDARKRFLIEARLAAKLNHPNIATVYESGEANNHIYIAMEFVAGESLKEHIKAGPLPVSKAIDITQQMGQGLAAAHAKGIIHRDIKPGNVMITPSGIVKIMDFGLAKFEMGESLTKTGSTIGTVAYMSPEQANGEKVDLRTDIWSLGVVFSEMLSGKRPFRGNNEQAIIYAILHNQPLIPSTYQLKRSSNLIHIIQKSLEKRATLRFQTIQEMLVDLTNTEQQKGSKKLTRTLGRFARKLPSWTHNAYLLSSLIGLFFICIMGLVLWSLPSMNHTKTQAFFDKFDHVDGRLSLDENWLLIDQDTTYWNRPDLPGHVTLYTQQGDYWVRRNQEPVIKNLLMRKISGQSYIVETKLTNFSPQKPHQQAGILLIQDRKNVVRLTMTFGYEPKTKRPIHNVHIVSKFNGDVYQNEALFIDSSSGKKSRDIWLRIEKRKSKYSFYYHLGGESRSWKLINSRDFADWDFEPGYVALGAFQGITLYASGKIIQLDWEPVPANFALFEVKPLN